MQKTHYASTPILQKIKMSRNQDFLATKTSGYLRPMRQLFLEFYPPRRKNIIETTKLLEDTVFHRDIGR